MEVNLNESVQMLKKIDSYLFDLRHKIGEGNFSEVFKGTNIHNGQAVAVKKIRVRDVKSKIAKRLLDCEVDILKGLSHPNIIKCVDVQFSVNNCYIIT
jgi:serine/threonine protein kinase